MKPELVDFAIRTPDHLTAAVDLIEKIVSAAGYSPQTFGIGIEGRAESGTALRFREQKTFRTLERKRRYWQAAVAWACEALLVIDRDVFGRTDVQPVAVDIEWPAANTNHQNHFSPARNHFVKNEDLTRWFLTPLTSRGFDSAR